MVAKIGFVEGNCGNCGKTLRRHRPADLAVCDCYEYCPIYGTKMSPYSPDLSTRLYRTGDIDVLYQCLNCGHKSKQKPVEIKLN